MPRHDHDQSRESGYQRRLADDAFDGDGERGHRDDARFIIPATTSTAMNGRQHSAQ